MIRTRTARRRKQAVLTASLFATGCTRAPSFDILGSFFPAWLVCLILGIPLTILVRWLLLRLHIMIVYPVFVYPGLWGLFTFALWLTFFR